MSIIKTTNISPKNLEGNLCWIKAADIVSIPLAMKKNGFIIMIDEKQSDHELLTITLIDLNCPFGFEQFESYERAISQFSCLGYTADYVFIDINLAQCNEVKWLQKIQDERSLGDATIVIYSSCITVEIIEDLQNIGIEEFIEKTDSRSHLKYQLILLFLKT